MTSWQGAWRLLRFDGSRSWIGLLITIVFVSYMIVVMMPIFDDLHQHENTGGSFWGYDLVYLSILPTMGFLMNRSVLQYWGRDPYTRYNAYLRTMPIGWNTIILARLLQFIVVLTIVSLYFFTLQYVALNELRELMTPGEYVIFSFIWYGYAMMAGSTYVFFEQSVKGKIYMFICFCYLLLYALVGLMLWQADTHLMFTAIEVSRDHSILWPLLSVLLGFTVAALMGVLIWKRNTKRNLLE
ncbi:hypothetical protein [Paenibacillus sp. CF384]|uniref:hypothetical protein n=1 Tax=Paenibacillus sp. CF384 TaxID=1884382 RepID=UPI0008979BF6|nr:hypothetical protein [Paenibacillus sp. CF384]SDX73732.1 hypothetical protein SAMN05518855_10208 [Paenibacillus sp. CF384]